MLRPHCALCKPQTIVQEKSLLRENSTCLMIANTLSTQTSCPPELEKELTALMKEAGGYPNWPPPQAINTLQCVNVF